MFRERNAQNNEAALDEIAERIRALGYNAPGSYKDYLGN